LAEIIFLGILLGATLSFLIGPVFLLLLDISLNRGWRKALIFDAGVLTADILFIILVNTGAALLDQPGWMFYIYLGGGVLIFGYGIHNIRTARKKAVLLRMDQPLPVVQGGPWVFYVKGFFMNFLNMGVLAYWLTVTLAVRANVDGDFQLMMAYFISTVAAYFATDLVKIFLAQKLKKLLTQETLVKIEYIVGIILLLFGVFMVVRGYLHHQGIRF
jgi:threonine/homoserine/homoserine lactone efflux protein